MMKTSMSWFTASFISSVTLAVDNHPAFHCRMLVVPSLFALKRAVFFLYWCFLRLYLLLTYCVYWCILTLILAGIKEMDVDTRNYSESWSMYRCETSRQSAFGGIWLYRTQWDTNTFSTTGIFLLINNYWRTTCKIKQIFSYWTYAYYQKII